MIVEIFRSGVVDIALPASAESCLFVCLFVLGPTMCYHQLYRCQRWMIIGWVLDERAFKGGCTFRVALAYET